MVGLVKCHPISTETPMAIVEMFRDDDDEQPSNTPMISQIPLDWGEIDPSQQFKILMKVKSLLFGGETSVSDYLANLADTDRPLFESELLRLVLIFHVGELVRINALVKMGVNDMTKNLMGDGMFPPGNSRTWDEEEITGYLGEIGFGDFSNVPDDGKTFAPEPDKNEDIVVLNRAEYEEHVYNRRLLGSLTLYGLEEWAWYEDAVKDVEEEYPD